MPGWNFRYVPSGSGRFQFPRISGIYAGSSVPLPSAAFRLIPRLRGQIGVIREPPRERGLPLLPLRSNCALMLSLNARPDEEPGEDRV